MSTLQFIDRGYIVLGDIKLAGLPERIHTEGYELQRKNEFHITLVGSQALTYLPADQDTNAQMQKAVSEFVNTNDLTRFELKDEYRLVKRGKRVTLVRMAEVKHIDKLYAFLNERFGIKLPVQPALSHSTALSRHSASASTLLKKWRAILAV